MKLYDFVLDLFMPPTNPKATTVKPRMVKKEKEPKEPWLCAEIQYKVNTKACREYLLKQRERKAALLAERKQLLELSTICSQYSRKK